MTTQTRMVTLAVASATAGSQLAPLARNTQAPATAFACSQLAPLARNTQAPATAFACSLLAALAPNKAVSESLIFMGPTAATQPP